MDSQNIWDDLWGSSEEETPIKSSSFNSIKMAQYFQERLFAATWSTGFAAVNIRAMAGQFSQWKRNGATKEDIEEMINVYMIDSDCRGKNPGWQDFLSRREQIAQSIVQHNEKMEALDNYDKRMEEYDEEAEMAAYLAGRNK